MRYLLNEKAKIIFDLLVASQVEASRKFPIVRENVKFNGQYMFLRAGLFHKSGISLNQNDYKPEKGLSCFPLSVSGNSETLGDLIFETNVGGMLELNVSYESLVFGNKYNYPKPLYLIAGDFAGSYGSDGEPLVRNFHIVADLSRVGKHSFKIKKLYGNVDVENILSLKDSYYLRGEPHGAHA